MYAGDFYTGDKHGLPTPVIQELIDAGLVGTMGRVQRIVRCYVPKGTKPFRLESIPKPPRWLK